jgi:hypothetical protein
MIICYREAAEYRLIDVGGENSLKMILIERQEFKSVSGVPHHIHELAVNQKLHSPHPDSRCSRALDCAESIPPLPSPYLNYLPSYSSRALENC